MSKASRFARHARMQTDRAISRVFRELKESPPYDEAFGALLGVVRERSSFLRRPEILDGRHLQVEALRNLALFGRSWLRSPDSWPGAAGSVLCVTASLAGHLLARYPVPKFLARVWFGGLPGGRRWFVEHAAGRRFRDLDLPLEMTRRMERVFLESPDHLTVERALRRAELLALDASPALVDAVLATRLGERFENGRFWRTVLRFFTRVQDELDPARVRPIVDFLQAIRHESVEVETGEGTVVLPPPRPDFSMKGRTLGSLTRMVERRHRSRGLSPHAVSRWEPSSCRPMVAMRPPAVAGRPPVRWEFVELTSAADLRREGAALHHCVGTYAWLCRLGWSRIWSLRRWSALGNARSVLTIDVDPRHGTVDEARGLRNRPPSGQALELLRAWARREDLRLSI